MRRGAIGTGVLLAAAGLAQAQSFTEPFNNVSTLPPAWALINSSIPLGTSGWFQGNPNFFPAQSGPGYIAANINNTTGGGTISNWLITPVRTLNNGDTLQFWTRTVAGSTFPDRLQVRLSAAGASTNVGPDANSVGDFTNLMLDINPTYTSTGYPAVWTQYLLSVSGLPGPTSGRFAFRYYVENGGLGGTRSNYIGIDEVVYTAGGVQTGACCLASGQCIVQTSAGCATQNGIYRGDNTSCANNDCPQPGACCLVDGSCTVIQQAACTAQSGIYRGDGAPCATANCPPPTTGACCLPNGSCAVLTLPNCTAQNGVYRGNDVLCANANCPPSATYIEIGDAGELPATAAVCSGPAGPLATIRGSLGSGDADMFQIQVCNAATFRATTVGGTTVDTQIMLFRSDGRGVTFNDDSQGSLQSTITSQFVAPLGNGIYYLALAEYPKRPNSATGAIWLDNTFSAESQPDGPGAAGPVTNWDSGSGGGGPYSIALTGVCWVPAACYANCDGSSAAPILNVSDFICFMNHYAAGDSYANCDGSTTPPILSMNDFTCFMNAFAAGCP